MLTSTIHILVTYLCLYARVKFIYTLGFGIIIIVDL